MNKHIAVDAPLDVTVSARISQSFRQRFMGNRWFISIMPRRRKNQGKSSTGWFTRPTRICHVHRGLHHLANAATDAYRLREKACVPSLTPARRRDRLYESATEAINLVAASFGEAFIKEAMRSSFRLWSTTPISCPGIFSVSARAPS